jgi:hypothetical protein
MKGRTRVVIIESLKRWNFRREVWVTYIHNNDFDEQPRYRVHPVMKRSYIPKLAHILEPTRQTEGVVLT